MARVVAGVSTREGVGYLLDDSLLGEAGFNPEQTQHPFMASIGVVYRDYEFADAMKRIFVDGYVLPERGPAQPVELVVAGAPSEWLYAGLGPHHMAFVLDAEPYELYCPLSDACDRPAMYYREYEFADRMERYSTLYSRHEHSTGHTSEP